MKKIIDISQYQNPTRIDYDALAKDIDGAILRVGYTGYGTGASYYKDKQFDTHYNELTKRGIAVGGYWYSCADTVAEGKAEAQQVLKHIQGKQFELPIYWDTEDNYHQAKTRPEELTDTAIAFLEELEQAGYFVGVYASSYWYSNRLELDRLRPYTLWVAHYGLNEQTGIERYLSDGQYDMWQYTSTGRVKGYGSNIDINHCKRHFPAVIRQAGLNGYGKQTTQEAQKQPQEAEVKPKVTRHVVKAGETFSGIAGRYGTTVAELARLNPQIDNVNKIYPNQTIYLHASAKPQTEKKYYRVKRGDTLVKIAESNGITLAEIKKLNPDIKNYNLIYPNQQIRVG